MERPGSVGARASDGTRTTGRVEVPNARPTASASPQCEREDEGVAELVIHGDRLRVVLSRWEKIGALSGDLSFPVGAISSVQRVGDVRSQRRGIRLPGTDVPGRLALGRWRSRVGIDFVAATRHEAGYVIVLDGERFDRLLVSSVHVTELDALAEGGRAGSPDRSG